MKSCTMKVLSKNLKSMDKNNNSQTKGNNNISIYWNSPFILKLLLE